MLVAALVALVAACGGPAAPGGTVIKVWTLENLPDRLEAQKVLAQRFTRATGVRVDLVGVDENQFQRLIRSSSASGDLPDAVGTVMPPAGVDTKKPLADFYPPDVLDGLAGSRNPMSTNQ